MPVHSLEGAVLWPGNTMLLLVLGEHLPHSFQFSSPKSGVGTRDQNKLWRSSVGTGTEATFWKKPLHAMQKQMTKQSRQLSETENNAFKQKETRRGGVQAAGVRWARIRDNQRKLHLGLLWAKSWALDCHFIIYRSSGYKFLSVVCYKYLLPLCDLPFHSSNGVCPLMNQSS